MNKIDVLSDDDLFNEVNSSGEEELRHNDSEQSHDSDTEQDVSSNDEDEDSNVDPLNFCLTGKDGVTKWSLEPCETKKTTQNMTMDSSGVKKCARNAKTELDCWKLFISDEMIKRILFHTNNNIINGQSTNKNTRNCLQKETATDELLALFGLMYIAGINGSNRRNLTELWRTDGTGIEIFRSAMSMQRFYFLQQSLRFDCDSDKGEDNIFPIRSFFEEFFTNCQNNYTPSEYLTIDEKLIPFRGKCPFIQFMPKRKAKYGIKAYALVDAKSCYTINLELYPGNELSGPYLQSNDISDVVDRLVRPVSKTNRNISFNNKFTSISLVSHLLHNHSLTSTGAIRKDKKEVPPSLIRKHGHKVNTSQFAFTEDMTLVSYRAKNTKIILVLSSLHHEPSIDTNTGDKQKPEIITFYDSTKSGVTTVDELCATYDVSRNCRRWPTAVFFTLMNIAALNAVIVYRENNQSNVTRRDFIRKLALKMLESHLSVRKNMDRLPREMRKRIYEQKGETMTYSPNTDSKLRRCKDCPSGKNRKTRFACNVCNKPVCLEHVVAVCQSCIGADSD